MEVYTEQGMLRVEKREGDYPGFYIYLSDRLITVIESDEDKDAIMCHTYVLEEEEPTDSIELVCFKKY